MLSDITHNGVQNAISEFDQLGREAFLAKYGYRKSRTYFLISNRRRYDSKAICGAAHGFDDPSSGPLLPASFSGGDKTVAEKLEQLGFKIQRASSSRSGWTSEERILALALYLQGGAAGRAHPKVVALSKELNERGFHPDVGSRENFRNPNGVALKLANFAALDPSYQGTGMTRHSAGDADTWHTYSGDSDLLTHAVERVRSNQEIPETDQTVESVTPLSRPIEEHLSDSYQIPSRPDTTYAKRREAELVQCFSQWLHTHGSLVAAHHYPVVHPPLRSDLADETANRLWEAKSESSRSSVRMALGQLLDYLRFEPSGWTGGVLLPNAPTADLTELVLSSGRALAWPTTPGSFAITESDQNL